MNIVGYNLSHDSSVCLVQDGAVSAALALERVARVKRGVVPAHVFSAAMAELTRQVLEFAGIGVADVHYWIGSGTESETQEEESLVLSLLGLSVPSGRRLSLPHPGHHLAHASAAFFCSGFDEAAAVVIDAYGSRVTEGREQESVFHFCRGAAPRVASRTVRRASRVAGTIRNGRIALPDTLSGIGEVYRVVTLALGFNEGGSHYDDAGKTMGLAPFGRPLSSQPLFMSVLEGGIDYSRAVPSLIDLNLAKRDGDALFLQGRLQNGEITEFHKALAAQIQWEFELAVTDVVRRAIVDTGCSDVALSGGCFLNSVANTKIKSELGIRNMFVFPAATDDGNAVGAALYAHSVVSGAARGQPAEKLTSVYWGPSRLSGDGLSRVLSRWGAIARQHPDETSLARAAAEAIDRGEIVGWFADRSEFGPRALGARSILCHPGRAGMKRRLNSRVKFREEFRPFAAAVLQEFAGQWFDMPDAESPFMLHVCNVRDQRRDQVMEVVHVDGTCRVQTVGMGVKHPFRSLLEAFQELTGLPMVLNTSFNLRGMPIVEFPDDAMYCLYGSRIDRLFIGEFEVSSPNWSELVPILINRSVFDQSEVMMKCDGVRSVSEIARECNMDLELVIQEILEMRHKNHLDWQGLPERPTMLLPRAQYQPA